MDEKTKEIQDRVYANISKYYKKTLSHEELVTFYNHWEEYHEAHISLPFHGPKTLATAVEKHVADKSTKILDIGAGTGLLGIELMKLGFTDIDGLDPSVHFSRSLKLHGYKNIHHEAILEGKETSLKTGSYKCVVSCAAFCDSHIPVEGLYEFLRVTSPGGIIGILLRKSYISSVPSYATLTDTMQKMEDDGLWKLLKRDENAPYYAADQIGYLVIYQKL